MSERIISDRVANGNYVEHIKTVKTFSGRYYSSVDTFGTYVGNFIPVDAFRSYFPVDQAPIFTLNPKKLPTSGETNLIVLLAELDETLLTFTKKFWKELSYGSFSWGLLPLLGEAEAIYKTLKKISTLKGQSKFEDTLIFDRDDGGTDFSKQLISGTVRWTGTVNMRELNPAFMFMDTIGFHPDLNTVWNLVPLSFAVDYFLNIGKLLSVIHTSGWITSVEFTGWRTVKVDAYALRCSQPIPKLYDIVMHSTFFQRVYCDDYILAVPPRSPLGFFAQPEPIELFNTAYLMGMFKKVSKNLSIEGIKDLGEWARRFGSK
jgi:hypothetical protein